MLPVDLTEERKKVAAILEAQNTKSWLPFWKKAEEEPEKEGSIWDDVGEPWDLGKEGKSPKPPKKSKFAAGSSFWDDVPDMPAGKKPKPYKPKKKEKWISAGGVVIPSLHPDERFYVYIRKPAGGFGGKRWTLAKGKVDEGETKEQAAVREVEEETGIQAKILSGSHLGAFEGSFSTTHYYMMIQTSGTLGRHDKETEEVRLLHIDDAIKVMGRAGNSRDALVLKKAKEYIGRMRAKGNYRKRLKTMKVNVPAKEVLGYHGVELAKYKKKGVVDETKTVLRVRRGKGKDGRPNSQRLRDFLRFTHLRPLKFVKGKTFHMAIVDRSEFERAHGVVERPVLRRKGF